MFLRIGLGSGAPWWPWYDGGRHAGSSCFHDLRACLLCFVHVLYVRILPHGKTVHSQAVYPSPVAGGKSHMVDS
jgi:hypothetical protein